MFGHGGNGVRLYPRSFFDYSLTALLVAALPYLVAAAAMS